MTADLTVKDACRYMCTSRSNIYRLIKKGSLTAYKAGRCTRITHESFNCLRNTNFTSEYNDTGEDVKGACNDLV